MKVLQVNKFHWMKGGSEMASDSRTDMGQFMRSSEEGAGWLVLAKMRRDVPRFLFDNATGE